MHEIQALIGSDAATAVLTDTWSEARRCELRLGFFIVPLRRQLIRQITGGDWHLPDLEDPVEASKLGVAVASLVDALRKKNIDGLAALIFTQCWGGVGAQASVLVGLGVTRAEPLVGPEAVNQALSAIGVRADGERDEFDTLGLSHWRSTEEIATRGLAFI